MSKTVPQMWEFQNHGDLFMYFAAWVLAVALGIFCCNTWTLLRASLLAQRVKNPPATQKTQEMQVQSPGWENPLEKDMATHPSIPAWENPMERAAWWAAVHGLTKSWND